MKIKKLQGRAAVLSTAVAATLLVCGCQASNGDEAEARTKGGKSSELDVRLHYLNARILLLECRQLNDDIRDVLEEEGASPSAMDDVLDYDEELIDHLEDDIDNDEELIDHHDDPDHDEELIDHTDDPDFDEDLIDHDETFKKLLVCRKDTLQMRKRYLQCAIDRTQCIKDGGSITQCNLDFFDCARETREGN